MQILLPFACPNVVERAVRANPVQPRAERSAAVELADLLPRFQERLLNHILSIDFIPGHTKGQAEYRAGVALYKHTKCVTIAAPRFVNGDFIAQRYWDVIHPAVRLDCSVRWWLAKVVS